jgi:hypothetical protein
MGHDGGDGEEMGRPAKGRRVGDEVKELDEKTFEERVGGSGGGRLRAAGNSGDEVLRGRGASCAVPFE